MLTLDETNITSLGHPSGQKSQTIVFTIIVDVLTRSVDGVGC